MGMPGHPGTSNPRPVGPYPQAPQPQFGNPLVTGNPNQTYGGPAQQQPPSEDSILQQSWVIPAVLMTILILVLLLVLISVT
jgi:hypothetical protein